MKDICWWHHQRRPLPLPCASAQPIFHYSRNICTHSRRREKIIMWGCIASWHGHWALSDMVACLSLSAIELMPLGNCFNAKESSVNVNAFGCFSVSPSSVGFHSGAWWVTYSTSGCELCVCIFVFVFVFVFVMYKWKYSLCAIHDGGGAWVRWPECPLQPQPKLELSAWRAAIKETQPA